MSRYFVIFSYSIVEEVVYEEVPDARTIETGDSIKVKQVLDESAIEAVQEFGYEIDFRSDYNKIIIMFIACIFALVAQYYPLRFPQNRVLLGVCCVMYCILNSLLQYIVTFIDKDVIITTKSTEVWYFEAENEKYFLLLYRSK